MSCNSCKSESLTTTLTSPVQQKKANRDQLELLDRFLQEGGRAYHDTNISERLKKLFRTDTSGKRRKDLFLQTIIFLWLSVIKPKKRRLSPSLLIDQAWHEFILFTEEYDNFCQKTAGHFIHHHPTTMKNRHEVVAMSSWFQSFDDIERFVGKERIIEWCWVSKDGKCSADCSGGCW